MWGDDLYLGVLIMMESWEHEESEEELGEKSTFPGLNKAHGFFHLIKRNQKDRDSYHQQQEERREVSS